MTEPDLPGASDARQTVEIEVEPTVTGRFARSVTGARVLRTRIASAREAQLAEAREKLWTPEKGASAPETKLWTPGSKE